MGVGFLQRHHVRSWADQVDARYGFVELVRRLVAETANGLLEAEFAIDEGVDLGGFDGKVRAEAESRWVPAGGSVWELSVRRDVGTKANEDYAKRVTAPVGWSTSETVYSTVSLRAWQMRVTWAEARTAEHRWSRVQALGLDDIMAWLSGAPQTEFWLAERLGLCPEEFIPAGRWWEQHQDRTGGLFNRALVLSGRGDAAAGLQRLIAEGSGRVIVEAAAVEEALEFIAAVGEASGGYASGSPLIDRMVFVTGPNAWRRLLAEREPQRVLVATDPEFGVDIASTPHTVVIPLEARGGPVVARPAGVTNQRLVVVPRLDSRSVAKALDTAAARHRGIDFQGAQELGALGRRSTSGLRRQLSTDPVIRLPLWARTDTATSVSITRAKTAALLAGAWTTGAAEVEDAKGDRHALTVLAGGNLDYETVEIELRAITRDPDPMLAVSDSIWRLVNPQEAWLLLADHLLTGGVLSRFLRVATRVLGEKDPLGGVSGLERLTSQVQGVGRLYSEHLRHGLARTLALLSAHGHDLSSVGPPTAVASARHCVAQLLNGDGQDGVPTKEKVRRLADLGDVLTLLAEAAPAEFVSAVNRTLRSPSEVGQLWFTDTEDDSILTGPSSPHTALLGALETLAWLPDHLADVADILLQLEVIDPGGQLANRPGGTFSAIFSAWAPQTSSDLQERLEVLEGLRRRLVNQDADDARLSALTRLLTGLIPWEGSTVMSGSRPQIRDFKPPPLRRDLEVESGYVEEITELLLSLFEHRVRQRRQVEGMLDLLKARGGAPVTLLSPPARNRVWSLFEDTISMFAPGELTTVGQRLKSLARLHQNHPEANWALRREEADRVAGLAEQIDAAQQVPNDPIEANAWLFDQYFPGQGPEFSLRDDYVAYEQALHDRRAVGVGIVMRTEGLNGLYRLAARAQANPRSAPAAFIGVALEESESNRFDADTARPSLAEEDIETRLLKALDLPVECTAASADAQHAAQIAHGYFGARFRRRQRSGDGGWTWMAAFLRREDMTDVQQARLIELTRDHPRAWQEAEALGPAALSTYWKLMNWAGLGLDFEHTEDVVRGFLSVGRAGGAVTMLTNYDSVQSLQPSRRFELGVEALEALDPNDPSHMAELIEWRVVTQLLDLLAEQRPLTADNLNEPLMQRLTRLELRYVGMRNPDESAPYIHDRMALDPDTFVELVCLAYRRSNHQSEPQDPLAHLSPEQRAQRTACAKAAFQILRSWQRPPGLDGAGVVNYEQLRTWMEKARQLLDGRDRLKIGEEHIGRVLSAAPPDPCDGIAPPIAIRRLLEEGQTPSFKRGLAMGYRSGPTGIKGGLATELVAESLKARDQATSDAPKVAPLWPRTARLLRKVADSHQQDVSIWQSEH